MRGPSFPLLSTAVLLIGVAVAGSHGKPAACQTLDASIVAHSGQPVGKEIQHDGSKSGRRHRGKSIANRL